MSLNKLNIADEHRTMDYNLIQASEDWPRLNDAPILAIDVETTPMKKYSEDKKAGLNPWHAQICGFSIAVPDEAWYIPIRHTSPGAENISSKAAFGWLQSIIKDSPNRLLVNHNIKFDLKFLRRDGVFIPRETDLLCTLVAENLVDENQYSKTLKNLADKHLKMPNIEEQDIKRYLSALKPKPKNIDYGLIPPDLMAPYACGDVERTLRLACRQKRIIEFEGNDYLWKMERRLTHLLTDMEWKGIRVDIHKLKLDKLSYLRQIIDFETELESLVGVGFNPNSGKELEEIVTNKLGLPIIKRGSPTQRNTIGEASFDDDSLKAYMKMYPEHAKIFWLIRKSRRLEHLLTAFIEPYLYWAHNGILHCDHKQCGARSGRMSCTNPNLQQIAKIEKWSWKNNVGIPLEEWEAPGARHYFIPRDEKILIAKDYSQIEYRLFAHYANSSRMLEAYRKNPDMDYHQWTTEDILENLLERPQAKHMNFGFIYGMGVTTLLKGLQRYGDQDISEVKGQSIMNKYHKEVPELNILKEQVKIVLLKHGYLKTILGRRRRGNTNKNAYRRSQGANGLLPYQGINAICQGSSADITKDRMVAVGQVDGILTGTGGDLLLSIHDELIFEVPKTQVKEYNDPLTVIMQTFQSKNKDRLRVPIYVGTDIIKTNWAEKKKYE